VRHAAESLLHRGVESSTFYLVGSSIPCAQPGRKSVRVERGNAVVLADGGDAIVKREGEAIDSGDQVPVRLASERVARTTDSDGASARYASR
jgi:hypothetical protein